MRFFSLRANVGGSSIGLVIFSAMLLVGDWFALSGLVGQAQADGYPIAQAIITKSKITEQRGSRGGRTYTLELAYEYVVEGNRFTGTRRRYYDMGTSNRQACEALQAQYPVGHAVMASYNPSKPTDVILEPGIQATDWIRNMFVLPLSILMIGAWRIMKNKEPEFDPGDQRFIGETETGWFARLPEISHLRVFVIVFCGSLSMTGFVLFIFRGLELQNEILGAILAGAVALGAFAAAMLSRYPLLVADIDASELIVPAGWFSSEKRVPFDAISDVRVLPEERSAGRAGKYEVYRCEMSWSYNGRFQLTTLEVFLQKSAALGLMGWVKVATGLVPIDASKAETKEKGWEGPSYE